MGSSVKAAWYQSQWEVIVAWGLVVVMILVRSCFMESRFILKLDPVGFADRLGVGSERVYVVKGN